MRVSEIRRSTRYTIGFAFGLIALIAAPEGFRWFHGGALAQQTLGGIYGVPPNTTVGTIINGNANFSATGAPGQTGTVIGGESNATGCGGQGQSVIGTIVAPGSSMTATATGTGGGGSVIGFRSTATAGGPGCP